MGRLFNQIWTCVLFVKWGYRSFLQWFFKINFGSQSCSSQLLGTQSVGSPGKPRVYFTSLSKRFTKENYFALTFLELSWRSFDAFSASGEGSRGWIGPQEIEADCICEKMDEDASCYYVPSF